MTRRWLLRRARRALPGGVALALCTAGCGTGSDLPATTGQSSGADVLAPVPVTMRSLDFNPISVHGKVGHTVVWTNADSAPHNVTYVNGPRFASSRELGPGATFAITLTQTGTIHYFCTLHPWMKATVVVSR
jgi:plastocyanin